MTTGKHKFQNLNT